MSPSSSGLTSVKKINTGLEKNYDEAARLLQTARSRQ